ncbi:hypothetical protein BC628DRAFT_597310 [Trametes gibbosa]|nr:hypothetical protein BC628DRAFT_597310 [Trametes gibbosa]
MNLTTLSSLTVVICVLDSGLRSNTGSDVHIGRLTGFTCMGSGRDQWRGSRERPEDTLHLAHDESCPMPSVATRSNRAYSFHSPTIRGSSAARVLVLWWLEVAEVLRSRRNQHRALSTD